ncbi:MAG: hypothetical protein H8D71_01020, partial [Deltaproteobacteria bacterium]|nr:hypothetical protein [Deltaproteobacteria bacterium]
MRRLGNARLRRQQRLAALSTRSTRLGRLSAFRRLPDTTARSLPFLGLPSLLADGFEVLHPLPQPVDEVGATASPMQPGTPGRNWVGAQTATSPWLSRPFTPARVASRREKQRPLERLAQRAPASKEAVERVRKELESGTVAKAKPSAAQISDEVGSEQGRSVRRIYKSMGGRSNPTRMVAVDYEAALPDDLLPPT